VLLVFLVEFVGQQGGGVRAPGEIGIRKQLAERAGEVSEPERVGLEREQPLPHRFPPLRSVELDRKRRYGAPLEVERAVRVATRREQEQGAPARAVQLTLVDREISAGEERDRRPDVGLGGALLEHPEQRSRVHRADRSTAGLASERVRFAVRPEAAAQRQKCCNDARVELRAGCLA
jgi:hypothetical protein